MTAAVSISFKIEKASPTGRYVSGWLSVIEKDGKVIEDTQGDRMSMETLRKGVHKYMRGSRVIKKQHTGDQVGEMVEIVMIDDDFVKALGATTTKRGAWGTAEITDTELQKAVVAKEVTGWSMGGKGKRVPIVKAGEGSAAHARRLASVKAARRAPPQSAARQRFREAAALWRNAQKRSVKKSAFFDRYL